MKRARWGAAGEERAAEVCAGSSPHVCELRLNVRAGTYKAVITARLSF